MLNKLITSDSYLILRADIYLHQERIMVIYKVWLICTLLPVIHCTLLCGQHVFTQNHRI